MRLYAEITKVDAVQNMVWGYASTAALDSQGEIISVKALADALDDYRAFSNIREMHQPSAVGVAKETTLDEKGLYVGAKIVDPLAWDKVAEGVYKGFSIGGCVTARDPLHKHIITGMKLTEISLVDRPANPEAVFDVFKTTMADDADDVGDDDMDDGDDDNGGGEDGEAMADAATLVQRMHDYAVALGAECDGDDEGKEAMHKHTHHAPSAAAAPLLRKLAHMSARLETMGKRLAELEATPAPAKGALRIVSKEEDNGAAPDRSAKDPLAAIKKAWQSPIHLMGR